MTDLVPVSDNLPERPPSRRYKLEHAWVTHRLIREVAQGEKTMTQLAAEYGVTVGSITHFKDRHADEIEQVRNNLADEFAGMWVVQKAARLAYLMRDIERLSESDDATVVRTVHSALKQVAEELGQLPRNVNVTGEVQHVHYTIEGVDIGDLS